jgi:hypothetical protein
VNTFARYNMNVNTIGECLCKIQYERKYNKVHEIHMKYKKYIGKSLKSMKYKKYIGKSLKSMKYKKHIEEILKMHETQEMYRGIAKSYKLF